MKPETDGPAQVVDPTTTPATPTPRAVSRRPLAGDPARAARAAVAQARIESPLGGITLAATARGLCGLWFDGQQHHPGRLDAPVDPAQRFLAMAIRELEAYWRGHPAPRTHPSARSVARVVGIRRAGGSGGHALPACRLDRTAPHRARSHHHLWRRRQGLRPRRRGPGGGRGDRAQSGVDHRAMPPCRRGQWGADRVRGRSRSQAAPARARGGLGDRGRRVTAVVTRGPQSVAAPVTAGPDA